MAPASHAVVLVDGCRTPFLRSNTLFRNLRSYDLARFALKGLIGRTATDKDAIDKVILGTVVSNITTSNVARDAMLGAGFSKQTPAFTVTLACISANMAISQGFREIERGEADAIVAGGTESLSDIPIRYRKAFRQKLIAAQRYRKFWDYFGFFKGLKLSDWLPEIPSISEFSTGRTMGEDADLMASRFGVSREEQDAYAMASHHHAAKARDEGFLAEDIVPVTLHPKYDPILEDNGIRGDTSLEKLARLKPAFIRPYGSVTAGNASFLTDGAAVVLLMSAEAAIAGGYQPLARIVDDVFTAQNPDDELLLGPAYAIGRLLKRHDLRLEDIDAFEIHEAFAGQVLANLKCLASEDWCREKLGLEKAVGQIPMARINPYGGSLSLGHPFGATGARLIKTAAWRLGKEGGKRAIVAACAAGGQGHAMLLEPYAETSVNDPERG